METLEMILGLIFLVAFIYAIISLFMALYERFYLKKILTS